MKQRLIVIGSLALSAVLLASAFVAGVRVGATESDLLQSTVRATLLVGELRALRAVKIDGLVKAKELELDGEVLKYHRLLESGHPWLLLPESATFEHERYLRQVAVYRKEFPPVVPALEVTGTDETSVEMRARAALIASTTEQIIRRFAQ